MTSFKSSTKSLSSEESYRRTDVDHGFSVNPFPNDTEGDVRPASYDIVLNEYLYITYKKGRTDYIVVTFSPAHPDYGRPGHYFGKHPIEKSDFSAIGIVSYKCDWYPIELLESYIQDINRITKTYSKVILYGSSMGAYAAIKYSKLLNADMVIALSPFKSINPDDSPYLGDYYKTFEFAVIDNMAIKQSDVAGKILALYDPLVHLDQLCIEDLSRSVENINYVKVFHGDHGLMCLVDKAEKFNRLISAALNDDIEGFAITVNRLRRNSSHNVFAILGKGVRTHPDLVYQALLSRRGNRNRNLFLGSSRHVNRLVYKLIADGKVDHAKHLLYITHIWYAEQSEGLTPSSRIQ